MAVAAVEVVGGGSGGEAGASLVVEDQVVAIGEVGECEEGSVVATGAAVEHDDGRVVGVAVGFGVEEVSVELDSGEVGVVGNGGEYLVVAGGSDVESDHASETDEDDDPEADQDSNDHGCSPISDRVAWACGRDWIVVMWESPFGLGGDPELGVGAGRDDGAGDGHRGGGPGDAVAGDEVVEQGAEVRGWFARQCDAWLTALRRVGLGQSSAQGVGSGRR